MERGLFIVFEGVDRCGKTTQAKLLSDYLRAKNIPVKEIRFPDRETVIGKLINSYLKSEQEIDDHVVHLLFSANRWEKKKEIERELASGTTIVCDRYSFSGIAYSTAKGLPLEFCVNTEVNLPIPDLTLYLEMPIEKLKERGDYGKERYENDEFLYIVDRARERVTNDHWEIIDALGKKEEVFRRIVEKVDELMKLKIFSLACSLPPLTDDELCVCRMGP